jgi:hypothetical protein
MLDQELESLSKFLNRKHAFGNSFYIYRDYFEKKEYKCLLGNTEYDRSKFVGFFNGEGLSKIKPEQCRDLDIVYKENKGGNIIFAA